MVSEVRKDYIYEYCKYMLSKFLTDQQAIDDLVNNYFDEALSHLEFEYSIDYTKDDLEEIGADICDWILDTIGE